MKMTTAKALNLLALAEDGATTNEVVTKAYRRAVAANHPDTMSDAQENGGVWTPATMAELQQAKKTLLDAIAGCDFPCAQCKGRGRVPLGMGTAQCGACKGTGDKRP